MGKARTLQVRLTLFGLGLAEQAAAGAVDVGLAGEGDGLEHVAPVAHQGRHLVEDAAAGEPVAGLAQVVGDRVVAVLPDAVIVEYLDEHVGADGHGDARVEEVARIDDDGRAASFGLKRAESGEQIVD